MKCHSCRMTIPAGGSKCPFCHESPYAPPASTFAHGVMYFFVLSAGWMVLAWGIPSAIWGMLDEGFLSNLVRDYDTQLFWVIFFIPYILLVIGYIFYKKFGNEDTNV